MSSETLVWIGFAPLAIIIVGAGIAGLGAVCHALCTSAVAEWKKGNRAVVWEWVGLLCIVGWLLGCVAAAVAKEKSELAPLACDRGGCQEIGGRCG